MLLQPHFTIAKYETNITGPAFTGLTVTASATINTKGSWATLISSTSYDCYGFFLHWHSSTVVSTFAATLLDLSISDDGGTTRQILIPDLMVGCAAGEPHEGQWFYFPLFIPKGREVACRIQSVVVSNEMKVGFTSFCGLSLPIPIFFNCDAIGVDTADSSGTSVNFATPGFGSWVNIGSTTSRNYSAILPIHHGDNDSGWSSRDVGFEVGISSTKIGTTYHTGITSGEELFPTYPPCAIYQNIPSGTQLQMRGGKDGSADNHDVAIYGFY